ncbi:MAG TPA: GNAT family N-acetyltransferase [Acidisarcina sp.]
MNAPDTTLHIESLLNTSPPEMIAAARELLREYGEFVLASTGPARFCAARLGVEIERPVESYAENGGELLLAFLGDAAVGCAGFRALAANVPERACELKRLWVRPLFRGAAIGDRLVEHVLQRAARAGFEAIYLDTEPYAMPAALRLYVRFGFEECAAYNTETAPGLKFFRKSLS